MSDPLASIAVLILLWGAAEAYWALKRRLWDETEKHSVSLYCPNRDGEVPIAHEETPPVRYNSAAGETTYACEACGRYHTWQWVAAPAPIYVGDEIRLQITSDGVVQAELDAD